MNTFAAVEDRIGRLKPAVEEQYSEALFAHRRTVYDRVYEENPYTSPVVRSALSLAQFLKEKSIGVSEDDLIAGGQQLYDFTAPEIPCDYDGELLDTFRKGYRIGLFCGALGGHVIAGYDRVLKVGFGALINAAKDGRELPGSKEGGFSEASLIICRAASLYAKRYAEHARNVAGHTDRPENRASLLRIASSCDWIATEPPRSFHEALQLLWITHEIITCEQRSGSLSLGRLDQVLNPFYKQDIENHTITPEEGQELIEALWLKFAGLRKGFQNITLGGSDGYGTDLTNDLSFFFLRATRKLKMDQPLLSVRRHPGTPDAFWTEVQDLIQEGMGFPAIFNEALVIEAKKRVGVDAQDAVDWGIVGCVEPSIPGREFSHTEGIRVNWAKVLELMLNRGECTITGEGYPLQSERDLADVDNFEEFYAWYKAELNGAVQLAIDGMNLLDSNFSNTSPYPFLSSTMKGCIEADLDVTAGSTVYNFCTVNALGQANVADSLAAINHAVFKQRLISLPDLADAVRNDFMEQESLRQAVSHYPKYGNDEPEPDRVIAELCEDFYCSVTARRNARGGAMQCGLYSVDSHGTIGEKTGALPDGRRSGISLANALSPVQGSDTTGPTAVVASCTTVDHTNAGNGMVLDLKFTPEFFSQIRSQGIFTSLVDTYFDAGGMEIQFNVIDRKVLLDAREHPQDHQELVVRVSGFSAYFVDLPGVVQDEIIARTEYSAV